MRRVGTAALGALLLAGCSPRSRPEALPYFRTAGLVPEWLSPAEATAPSMHRIGPFSMVDQFGQRVTERALRGRVTVAHFFFTRCRDICPVTTGHLAQLLDSLPRDDRVEILSYSVTPGGDSVAALRAFAREHRLTDPRWHLLTGDPAELARLARESYFVGSPAARDYGVDSVAHTESLLLVDGEGRIRGIYAGMLRLEMERLGADVRQLLEESERAAGR